MAQDIKKKLEFAAFEANADVGRASTLVREIWLSLLVRGLTADEQALESRRTGYAKAKD